MTRYLADGWEDARDAALARDRGCRICGSTSDVAVRHVRAAPVGVSPDPHHLSNLIAVCDDCEAAREWRPDVDETLDPEGRVPTSQLVHALTRDTIARLHDPAGPWILRRYLWQVVFSDRTVCGTCFRELETTRSRTEFCSLCGHRPHFHQDGPVDDVSRLCTRTLYACYAADRHGVPVDPEAAKRATRRAYDRADFETGSVSRTLSRILQTALAAGIRAAYDPDAVDLEYDPLCPAPAPV